jgi:hypothetical protein
MTSISTDTLPLLMLESPVARVRPLRAPEVPRPRAAPSGLFPAAAVVPEPPIGTALRLRRAVAWTVVLGTVGLLVYASWQRVVLGGEPEAAVAMPVGP